MVSYTAANEDTNRQVTHIEFRTLWACAPTVSLLSSLLNILYLPHTDITYTVHYFTFPPSHTCNFVHHIGTLFCKSCERQSLARGQIRRRFTIISIFESSLRTWCQTSHMLSSRTFHSFASRLCPPNPTILDDSYKLTANISQKL